MVAARHLHLPEQYDVDAAPLDDSSRVQGAPETGPATMADILAALRRAPARRMTEEERALLAELDEQPVRWLSHEEFVGELRARSDPR
jgi:hypothetical protein